MIDIPFRAKEVSWLSFNARVLQEAQNPAVPLLERVKFLGIYSSNLDEFFRVRVATLRRLVKLKLPHDEIGIPNPAKTLKEVNDILKGETELFNQVYADIFRSLEKENIRVINEKQVPKKLRGWLDEYFTDTVLPHLMPIIIKSTSHLKRLKDHPMYLAVRLSKANRRSRPMHALIEIPDNLPRFVKLPRQKKDNLVMYLDDVIRYGLHKVFASTAYDSFESYALKFTRDAEIELDQDITESFYEKLSEGLRARETGLPVRVNYDVEMPKPFLRIVKKALQLTGDDTEFPGAHYHNRKDLMKFPDFGRKDLKEPRLEPVPHPSLQKADARNIMRAIRDNDILLHFPYHSFTRFIDLLRQASIDPFVRTIKLTQYRVAKDSCVARAMMTAVNNGKEVTVLVEPTARFDEEANIRWANRYQSAGVKVILGVSGLKVHSKLCLIERMEHGRLRSYSCVGTGNFNEDTARLYTDHMLLTYDQEIGEDVNQIFKFFRRHYDAPKLKHLICAPFNLRSGLYEMIQTEIDNAKAGKPAEISIKINNLSDYETVRYLYRAAKAGVKMRLIIRSMYSFLPNEKVLKQDFKAIGIVDKFLEHTRILIFHNDGDRRYFLSSADFLPRNFDSRCETICPVYEPRIRKELDDFIALQWRDGVKARQLDTELANRPYVPEHDEPVRSQVAIEEYLRKLSEKN